MAAAAWWAWRSRISSTAHGGGNAGDDDGCSLLPAAGGNIGSSGTTTYSTSTGSRSTTGTTISDSFIILPQPAPVVEENADHELGEEERVKKQLKHLEALVLRFPSDRSAPESWLSELEVDWVLHLAHVSESAGRKFISGELLYLARSWILALFEITKSISTYFGRGLFIISKEGGPPASEFVRFFKATLSKMLPFVDAIVAVRTRAGSIYGRWGSVEPADEKLQALILLRDALSTSTAPEQILSSCVEETRDLLPVELLMAKLHEAIWDTMQETTAGFMSSWGVTPISSDIHPITRSLISYIKVLWVNYGTANLILHDAFLRGESVPDNENASHLTNLTKEMIHSLEQMLARSTHSVSSPWNKSLQFLFLVNNFHFIHQQKQLWPLAFPTSDLAGKIDDYIKSYIQLSWAPVLKCLHSPTPRCFSGNSPLPKFEPYFQNTYNAQKFWKVPDPGMRRRIREAIIEEVIPGFTDFLKYNTLSTPRISPQEMTRMLQELFEG